MEERLFDNGAHIDKMGDAYHGWIRVRISNDRTTPDGREFRAITKRATSKGTVADIFAFGTYAYGSGKNLKYHLGNDVLDDKSRATVRISMFSHIGADGKEVNAVDVLKLQPGANIIVTGTFTRHEYNGRVSIEVLASDIQYDGRGRANGNTAAPQQAAPTQAAPQQTAPKTAPAQAAPAQTAPAASTPATDTPQPQNNGSFVDPFAEFMDANEELPFA